MEINKRACNLSLYKKKKNTIKQDVLLFVEESYTYSPILMITNYGVTVVALGIVLSGLFFFVYWNRSN